VLFVVSWVAIAAVGIKKKQSKVMSIAGGFLASIAVLFVSLQLFDKRVEPIGSVAQASSAQSVEETSDEIATQNSTLEFNTGTVMIYMAAAGAMVQCNKLSDAQAQNVGNVVRYMGKEGGIPNSEVQSTVKMATRIVINDLRTSGGCSGEHFKEYERNYYEFIEDPALAHLQIR